MAKYIKCDACGKWMKADRFSEEEELIYDVKFTKRSSGSGGIKQICTNCYRLTMKLWCKGGI